MLYNYTKSVDFSNPNRKPIDKLTKAGKVAVIYSNVFGTAWYNHHHCLRLVFDPHIVLIHQNPREVEEYVQEVYRQEVYADGLAVAWIALGSEFMIQEYDGKESVVYKEDFSWITA